jgi:hypothetical protein
MTKMRMRKKKKARGKSDEKYNPQKVHSSA